MSIRKFISKIFSVVDDISPNEVAIVQLVVMKHDYLPQFYFITFRKTHGGEIKMHINSLNDRKEYIVELVQIPEILRELLKDTLSIKHCYIAVNEVR